MNAEMCSECEVLRAEIGGLCKLCEADAYAAPEVQKEYADDPRPALALKKLNAAATSGWARAVVANVRGAAAAATARWEAQHVREVRSMGVRMGRPPKKNGSAPIDGGECYEDGEP